MPVPRYALLISDNPPSTTPRTVVTDIDGAANVHLRPGNYIVESDAPFVFEGKAYEWTQIVDVAAGRDATLTLTDANAQIGAATAAAGTTTDAAAEISVSSLLAEWQDSVVALWTPTTHASGFIVDADGLVATNQRVIGSATSIEVQLAPDVKVAASVLGSDPDRDVAVLRLNPAPAGSIRPVPLSCGDGAKAVVKDQEIVTIGSPLRETKGPRFGVVSGVEAHAIVSDLVIPAGSSGGPVFTSAGTVVGMTSVVDDEDLRRRGTARIVRAEDVCVAVAAARTKLKDGTPPGDAHLPVEPSRPFPPDALKEAARRRVGSLSPYLMSSSDFDIAFITPIMIYAAQDRAAQMSTRDRSGAGSSIEGGLPSLRLVLDFGNWSEYVADSPPVLLVRVTPKMVESFWTKMARGAAQTQGMQLPPFKRMRSGFSRLRAFCGDAEVAPIHPLKIEQRVSGSETLYEGLSVFDPGALSPSCGSVKLVLFSEKEPQKSDTRVVDAKIVQQIWDDFAPYRAQ
jgi:hypothetical protein